MLLTEEGIILWEMPVQPPKTAPLIDICSSSSSNTTVTFDSMAYCSLSEVSRPIILVHNSVKTRPQDQKLEDSGKGYKASVLLSGCAQLPFWTVFPQQIL